MNTIQQAHILLVDDNTDLLRLLEEQLRGAGYQNIRTVQNCAAAQTAFAAEMPELMILDINLPDGTTLALTATERTLLRKLAENRGHIVTYDALCEAVWGADYYGIIMGMKTVWVFISGICGKSWNRSRAGRAFCRR